MYTQRQREYQDLFDSRRLADKINERLVSDRLDAQDTALIERQFMFFIATVDEHGRPNCSFKGGAPGFVKVLDDRTLVFPDYDGNGMYLSIGNIASTRNVGLLFIDFLQPNRLRVNGEATVNRDDPLTGTTPGAKLIIRVKVTEVFPNCSRYVPQMKIVEPSRFIPAQDIEPPVPDWKKSEWAKDVLPRDDI